MVSTPLSPADRALLRALSRGERMAPDLAGTLGVTESAIRSRAWRLADRGLVRSTHAHGFAFYALTPEGRRAHLAKA